MERVGLGERRVRREMSEGEERRSGKREIGREDGVGGGAGRWGVEEEVDEEGVRMMEEEEEEGE